MELWRALSLEPLTLPDVQAPDLVRIAGDCGYSHVSFVLNTPVPAMRRDSCVTDLARRAEIGAALRTHGLGVSTIECFNLTADADVTEFEAGLACGGEFGARTASAIVWENGDRDDVLAKLRHLCDAAAEHGIGVNLEFIANSASMGDLDTAVALARDADRPNARLMLDLTHVMRTGATLDQLRALPPDLVGGAQIADGPLYLAQEDLLAEAGGNRQTPGEGEFPIREFVELLPPDIVLGVEVPQVAKIGTVSPEDRAAGLIAAVKKVL